jgi:predicted esterase
VPSSSPPLLKQLKEINMPPRIQVCPFETQDYQSRQYGDARIDSYVTEPANGVNSQTGLLLLIHGWGNDGQEAYAEDSLVYADRFNLVVTRVEFRQCGREAHHPSPGKTYDQPYDFSKLQTIDCLRAAYATLARYPQINRSRLMIWGGSQGGHLGAQCLIFAPHLWALAVLNCGVYLPLSGCKARELGFGFDLHANGTGIGFAECALGEGNVFTPAEEDIRNPWKNAALMPSQTPIIIIHGTMDTTVDIKHSVFLQARLLGLGYPAAFYPIENGDHGLQSAAFPDENSRLKATQKYATPAIQSSLRPGVDLFPSRPTRIAVRGGSFTVSFPNSGPFISWHPAQIKH